MNRCIVPGCGARIDPQDDMCMAHWSRVPPQIRAALADSRPRTAGWTPSRHASLLAAAVRAVQAVLDAEDLDHLGRGTLVG